MVDIKYSIVNDTCDPDSFGMEGFFQFICNGKSYGNFYSGSLEKVMWTVSVFDWFERILTVVIELKKKDYVILSDTESINTWIEFDKRGCNIVVIGIIHLTKLPGSKAIEYAEYMNNMQKEYIRWYGESVSYEEFKDAVVTKAIAYCNYLKQNHCKKWIAIHKLIRQL